MLYLFIFLAILVLAIAAAMLTKKLGAKSWQKSVQVLSDKGFRADSQVELNSRCRLCVDKRAKRWCLLLRGDSHPRILEYDELKNYKIIDHGVVLAGGGGEVSPLMMDGFIESTAGGKGVGNACKELLLAVYLTDGKRPDATVSLINQATVRSSRTYRDKLKAAQEAVKLLSVMETK